MSAQDVHQELDQIQKNQDELNARLENSRNDTTPQINPSLLSVLKGQASARSTRGTARALASARAGPPGSVGRLNTLFYAVLFQLWRCVERRKRSVKHEVFDRLASHAAKVSTDRVHRARALAAALDKIRRQRLTAAMGRWQWWLDPCWPLGPPSDAYNFELSTHHSLSRLQFPRIRLNLSYACHKRAI